MPTEPEELELTNRLDAAGLTVYKAPTSGSGTSRQLVDITAWGLNEAGEFHAFAIEHKSSSGDRIYLAEEQIEQLRSVATGPFEPVVSTYFKYVHGKTKQSEHPPYGNDADDGYRFIHLADLQSDENRTPGKRYRIKRDENWQHGLTMRELLTSGQRAIADGSTEAHR